MMHSPLRTAPTLGTILKWLAIAVVVSGFAWYGLFQARVLIAGPTLSLDAPHDITHTERVITVSGTAQNVSSITLNGRPIFTDEAGRFTEQLVLESGYTIMTIRATDRYGRVVELIQPYVYTPAYL